ncbi:MAG: VOC family protein [Clostridioides sp.]|nr:VOC family protein [Clostridioides sp.]
MDFKFVHNNINVTDLNKSTAFYEKALNLKEVKRKEAEDGSFILSYLGDGHTPHALELTWLRDWDRPYNLGDNEFHLALEVDDFEEAKKLHQEMNCICFVNDEMGIYFIADPDNYWIEILPQNH